MEICPKFQQGTVHSFLDNHYVFICCASHLPNCKNLMLSYLDPNVQNWSNSNECIKAWLLTVPPLLINTSVRTLTTHYNKPETPAHLPSRLKELAWMPEVRIGQETVSAHPSLCRVHWVHACDGEKKILQSNPCIPYSINVCWKMFITNLHFNITVVLMNKLHALEFTVSKISRYKYYISCVKNSQHGNSSNSNFNSRKYESKHCSLKCYTDKIKPLSATWYLLDKNSSMSRKF